MGATAGTLKAVLVDGASLRVTQSSLGIEILNFAGLYQLLVRQIGICRELAFKPLIVFDHAVRVHAKALVRDAVQAGFDTIFAPSEGGVDDFELLKRLGPLTRSDIKEIVMLTCDGSDFGPVLHHKVRQERITVHWVATRVPFEHDGCCRMSDWLIAAIETGVFRFVEMADHTNQITLRRPRGRWH